MTLPPQFCGAALVSEGVDRRASTAEALRLAGLGRSPLPPGDWTVIGRCWILFCGAVEARCSGSDADVGGIDLGLGGEQPAAVAKYSIGMFANAVGRRGSSGTAK
jgi:hypothetical protein